MKKIFLFGKVVALTLLLGLIHIQSFGQSIGYEPSVPVDTSKTYSDDFKIYFSKIAPSKIPTGILIDRVELDTLMFGLNGYDIVTSINCSDWVKLYKKLRTASNDTTNFLNWNTLHKTYDDYYASNVYWIGLMDFSFNKITKEAIDNGDFTIGEDDYILDNHCSPNSYSTHRLVASSCFEHNIIGDDIRFMIPDFFFTNNKTHNLKQIEIDFGNGSGFQPVNMNEIINVNYGSNSEYIEVLVRLALENNTTNEMDTCYSMFSVFRTALSTVSQIVISDSTNHLKSTPLQPDGYTNDNRGLLYYPVGHIETATSSSGWSANYWVGRDIEYCILYSTNNRSGKLRRPLIIVDAFDPKNHRDYYGCRYDAEMIWLQEKVILGACFRYSTVTLHLGIEQTPAKMTLKQIIIPISI